MPQRTGQCSLNTLDYLVIMASVGCLVVLAMLLLRTSWQEAQYWKMICLVMGLLFAFLLAFFYCTYRVSTCFNRKARGFSYQPPMQQPVQVPIGSVYEPTALSRNYYNQNATSSGVLHNYGNHRQQPPAIFTSGNSYLQFQAVTRRPQLQTLDIYRPPDTSIPNTFTDDLPPSYESVVALDSPPPNYTSGSYYEKIDPWGYASYVEIDSYRLSSISSDFNPPADIHR